MYLCFALRQMSICVVSVSKAMRSSVLQGDEDQQSLLLEQQAELSRLHTESRSSSLELQRLQRVLGNRDSELALLQQARGQLEQELEQLQQQKKKGDKTINVSNIGTHTETGVNNKTFSQR